MRRLATSLMGYFQTHAPQQRRTGGGLRVDGNRGIIPPANVRGATSETRMSVVECDVPSESALGKTLIERADFSDAYRAPLRRPEAGVGKWNRD